MSKINYDLQKIKGLVFDVDGVLSPIVVPLGCDGNPQRMANVRDGYAIKLALKRGLKIAIISGGCGEGLAERFKILGVQDVYLKAGMKLPLLQSWMQLNGLTPEEVAYVGDDVPDRDCLDYVGLSVVPADAADDLIGAVRYIAPVKGGYGVARDLIEEVLKAQDKWPTTDSAY